MKIILILLLIVLSVMSFSAADDGNGTKSFTVKPNEKKDVSKEVQKALDDCFASGGGVVNLLSGIYRFDNPIVIPRGVSLVGVWQGPHQSELDKGTQMYVYCGKDKENNPPFIKLTRSSTIKGVTIYYPEQKPSDIRPYPWTIQGEGTHPSVIDVTLPNSYNGIDFGTHPNEMHYISNLYGSPINIGIYIDKCTDIGRVENVHYNMNAWVRSEPDKPASYWDPMFSYCYLRTTAFKIGHADWEMFTNVFSIATKIGFHFIETSTGAANNGVYTNVGIDYTQFPILVDQAFPAGISITNGQFVAGEPEQKESFITTGPKFQGNLQLTNCNFWGPGHKLADLNGPGHVSFNQCNFTAWPYPKKTGLAFDVKNGSLTVMGSVFAKEWDSINIGENAVGAVIMGNTYAVPMIVNNNSKCEIVNTNNIVRTKSPNYGPE